MRRREFIALVGAAAVVPWSTGVHGQEVRKLARIGFLSINTQTAAMPNFEELRSGLRDLGYEENATIKIEQRYADGNAQTIPKLVGELIEARVDVIVTASIPAA